MPLSEADYQQLLDIRSPWRVAKVVLGQSPLRVDVFLDHPPGVRWSCPVCGKEHGCYDHEEERTWRHTDSCGYPTFLHARLPRIQCGTEFRTLQGPWAEDKSRISLTLESHAIAVLQECDLSGAKRLTGLDWDTLWRVLERAVARGQARKAPGLPERIGIDEKSFGRFHDYETLVYNLDKGTVEHMSEGRTQASLDEYFDHFSPEERAEVKAVALDMWDPYIQSVRRQIPDAERKLVFDRFHAMRYVTGAVDETRRREHAELCKEGNQILTKTRYLWLWNEDHIPPWRRAEFSTLKAMDLKVGRAWSIKENLRLLWGQLTLRKAQNFFKRWYFWATHSRLAAIVKAARTLKAHAAGVLNFVVHGITNACAEGLNSKIEMVQRMACGFRNRKHFRTAIYFHCGGLDLFPEPSAPTGSV